jgi:hypothetical protein
MRCCIILVFTLLTLAKSAFADAIDGEWCLGAKKLFIKGPEITLPEGGSIDGDYSPNTFVYIQPAGGVVYLNLIAEDELNFYLVNDGNVTDAVLWKRCGSTP